MCVKLLEFIHREGMRTLSFLMMNTLGLDMYVDPYFSRVFPPDNKTHFLSEKNVFYKKNLELPLIFIF